ncbi:hypothetical protein DFH11DRAFT_1689565 [Phellopilus nigrolimitatus]|nr:hypothetical protein DFH11DRAFT_1689565 [Phellopilus nigrolimitatus]
MPRQRSLRALTLNQTVTGLTSGPPSPTLSEATQASQMNFGAEGPETIITRADLKASLQAYENLLNTSAGYREALMHMSRATAGFADAMEACASLKGTSYLSGSRLMASSGLHHLMGNHWHILASDSIEKQFERPLRQHLDTYRAAVSDRSATYEKALREKSRIIRQTEMENMNLGRKKNRNLQSFREALTVLQRQVEELDGLRVAHYQEILDHEEEVWDFVQGKVSLVVRSTLGCCRSFHRKSVIRSDPVIEPMLQSIPDPFDSYGPPKPEDQIFSILAPLSIFNASSSPSPQTTTAEIEPAPAFASSPSGLSWTSGHDALDAAAEWADVHTPVPSPPPSARSTSTITVPRAASPRSRCRTRRAARQPRRGGAQGGGEAAEAAVRHQESKAPPAIGTGSASSAFVAFSAHGRDASADTVRPPGADAGADGLRRNSFADDPVWGSHETASSATLHGDGGDGGGGEKRLNGAGSHERLGGFDPPAHDPGAKDGDTQDLPK